MQIGIKALKTKSFLFSSITTILIGITIYLAYYSYNMYSQNLSLLNSEQDIQKQLSTTQQELEKLQTQDQVVINQKLTEEVKNIHDTYGQSISSFEKLLDLKEPNQKQVKLDALFATSLKYLADKNYASAAATLTQLNKDIETEKAKSIQTASTPVLANVPASNTPPASGFAKQQVQTDQGSFVVDIVSADLNSTKVIVDTASESDCSNDCPALPLADYVSRNGAFAGINGSFFCPPEYPNCAGKKNSFDTLLMNKNKKYFNSDNNVYSTVPAVIFQGNSARFIQQSLEWGRDTSPDAVLANYPLLVFNGESTFSGSGDTKLDSKGNRCFIAVKGNTVYIGVVRNATGAQAALVLKTLGMQNALGLDQGGSTALWFGGRYVAGPGRNIPNAILFVKK